MLTAGSASSGPSLRNHQQQRMWPANGERPSDEDDVARSSDEEDEDEDVEEEADDRGNKRVQLSTLQERSTDAYAERALIVWSPYEVTDVEKLEEYIKNAEKIGFHIEQALGLLAFHKHSMKEALEDLPNYEPFPDDWSPQDKLLFENAFEIHGKNFKRLQLMLPEKSIASLVKYYYSWKKTRLKSSYIDKCMEKSTLPRLVGDGSTAGDLTELLAHITDHWSEERSTICSNCSIPMQIPLPTAFGSQCSTCYKHWAVTGNHRPLVTSVRRAFAGLNNVVNGGSGDVTPAKVHDDSTSSAEVSPDSKIKGRVRPPKGISVDHDDLLMIGSQSVEENLNMLKKLDDKVQSLRQLVQKQKQWIAMNERELFMDEETLLELEAIDLGDAGDKAVETGEEDEFVTDENNSNADSEAAAASNGSSDNGNRSGRSKARWTKDEILIVVEGFRRFGVNSEHVAKLLENRTEKDLLKFLSSASANGYSTIFLEALKDYEAVHGRIPDSDLVRKVISGKVSLPSSGPGSVSATAGSQQISVTPRGTGSKGSPKNANTGAK
ncbi:unnamed protein product [Notodromas monacha]|uniref:REST corepressor n=1 Tax=Notodromas monacha TaxID=399045 RepID=A0A7R9BJN8_9CRUS|nr:unnamed protein product [Notodromas monacha]CAG0915603.1 unnamed protein product [Notodromas monacha]